MHPHFERLQHLTRRHFLKGGSLGLGSVALAGLLAPDGVAAPAPPARDPAPEPPPPPNPLPPKPPHSPGKAKRVIYLHLSGAPPHLDLFDYKPELVKRSGQNCPDEYTKGKRFAFTSGTPKLLGTPRSFKKYGKGGVEMSDAIPHLHDVADDLCVIRSMNTDQFN